MPISIYVVRQAFVALQSVPCPRPTIIDNAIAALGKELITNSQYDAELVTGVRQKRKKRAVIKPAQ
jgi:hypothetical protein